MTEYAKIEEACEILNVMIGVNGQFGYDRNNKTLMQLLEYEIAFKKSNKEVVDKIIEGYSPKVRNQKFIL